MRQQGPTSWLVNGCPCWPTAFSHGVHAGGLSNIGLSADPHGPLALSAGDDSLGRLILPRGMAFDNTGILYLLDLSDPWEIKCFIPERARFEALPEVGGAGAEARQFCSPTNIAIAGRDLYVADAGNRRVQVFALGSLGLRYIWGPWDAEGCKVKADDVNAWEPVDVAACADAAYILDRGHHRVYRHQPGDDRLHLVIDARLHAYDWTRIALDREGRIYLLNRDKTRLDVFDARGQSIGTVKDADEVRERFAAPAIRLEHKEHFPDRFYLPQSLTKPCDRRPPAAPLGVPPLGLCLPARGGLLFDRTGNAAQMDPTEPLGPKLYLTQGVWISQALDSQIYGCQWHRIELDFADLPPGTQVRVSTYVDQERPPDEYIRSRREDFWETCYTATGPMQAPGDDRKGDLHEFLVQNRQKGQYLWLRLELYGDGYATPLVRAIRVHYPRESYLSELPAVYAAEEESRWFLERFLSIFQTEWDVLEQRVAEIARYFDPQAAPDGEFLEYLAQWLALPLEGEWTPEQKRNLLAAAPRLYARRGTLAGLRDVLQVYLQNLTALTPAEQRMYPQLVEGFRERQHLMLSREQIAELGHGAPLWSLSVVGRFQFGHYARADEARLVGTGDPEHDLFDEYAHRFRVFIPAAWVPCAEDERKLRRALDAEKPSHTGYDLCLVEPRLRVGVQSTVGLDTIIGDYPVARLACCHEDAPSSRPPRQRLGYDTVLACRPAAGPGFQLAPTTRVGLDTILI
jgi:phage tail-like protein